MATKRSPAKPKPAGGMTKEEAYNVLQVASTADGELIIQAYWHLARKFQAEAGNDRSARRRLDELNRAYLALSPKAEANVPPEAPEAPGLPRPPQRPTTAEPALAAALAAWIGRLVRQTGTRWPGRAPEVAIITITLVVLGLLALSSGANATWTLVTLAVAAVTIVAPWRRT